MGKHTLLSPDELLDIQISDINSKIDNLNEDMTNLLKSSAEVAQNLKNLEQSNASPDVIERRKRELNEQEHRKQNIVKKLKLLEGELSRKEKERGS